VIRERKIYLEIDLGLLICLRSGLLSHTLRCSKSKKTNQRGAGTSIGSESAEQNESAMWQSCLFSGPRLFQELPGVIANAIANYLMPTCAVEAQHARYDVRQQQSEMKAATARDPAP
jgi:hypothetical protein